MDAELNSSPSILLDSKTWTIVYKPHGMPTAPLAEGQPGTLLYWYLQQVPEAAAVRGKKAIERGLIHRLDTPTEGLVLIAKTQETYESFQHSQEQDRITKQYEAVCDSAARLDMRDIPRKIESRFRSWGPGAREVRPVFRNDLRFAGAGRDYVTLLESCFSLEDGRLRCVCSLTRGYRHQVRTHLASIGLPIVGDALYNPRYRDLPREDLSGNDIMLLLCATGLIFPDPDSLTTKAFSLR